MANTRIYTPPVSFHPGVTLEEKLREMRMGVKEFAVRTSKPEKTIFSVIDGKSSVTSDMAVAFESVTGIPASFWLTKQRLYDEYIARVKMEERALAAHSWAEEFPIAAMAKLGWIPPEKTKKGVVTALFSFFQVSTEKAWKDYYLNQELKVAFSISLKNTKNPYAISAWLRQGEIQASKEDVAPFSYRELKTAISELNKYRLANESPSKADVKESFAKVGVKLVFTPCVPKAPVNGSTRWISGTPCVQMAERFKDMETFWYTLFHELGHVLLHGKKDVFLDEIDYQDKRKEKEMEADAFARKVMGQ